MSWEKRNGWQWIRVLCCISLRKSSAVGRREKTPKSTYIPTPTPYAIQVTRKILTSQQLSFLALRALLRMLQSPLVSFAALQEQWVREQWVVGFLRAVINCFQLLLDQSQIQLCLPLSLYQQWLSVPTIIVCSPDLTEDLANPVAYLCFLLSSMERAALPGRVTLQHCDLQHISGGMSFLLLNWQTPGLGIRRSGFWNWCYLPHSCTLTNFFTLPEP